MSEALAEAHRQHWSRLVAVLAGGLGDVGEAEECTAEAFARAADQWPRSGPPDNPPAWLLTTARRVAVDRRRREVALHRRLPLLVADPDAVPVEVDDYPDDRLRLMVTCAHPDLPEADRLLLMLRVVGGVPTQDLARLFLVQHPAMSARLTRAKKRVRGLGFPSPDPDELADRMDAVRRTLYLLFTTGYADPGRTGLADEAVRLTRQLLTIDSDESTRALLALMLLQHSRRDTRCDEDGRLVLLADQDRARWDAPLISEALRLLLGMTPVPVTELHLQAAIAAAHAVAADDASTDWPRVAALYAQLEELTASPVVRLNRAVAVARVHGPLAALDLLRGLEDVLSAHHLFFATRADLRRRSGVPGADADYRVALGLAPTEAERRFLRERLERLEQ